MTRGELRPDIDIDTQAKIDIGCHTRDSLAVIIMPDALICSKSAVLCAGTAPNIDDTGMRQASSRLRAGEENPSQAATDYSSSSSSAGTNGFVILAKWRVVLQLLDRDRGFNVPNPGSARIALLATFRRPPVRRTSPTVEMWNGPAWINDHCDAVHLRDRTAQSP